MTAVDPTRYHVAANMPPIRAHGESFAETMADQLRHAPWLGLSITLHALVFALLLLWPAGATASVTRVVQLNPPRVEEPPEVVEPPDEVPKPEETEDEVILQEAEFDENDVDTENLEFTDSNLDDPSFTNDAWDNVVGLAGGPPGKFVNRGRGRHLDGRHGRQTAVAIENALKWLLDHQDADGKWDADEFMKHDVGGTPNDGPGNPVHDIGVTGLALLAFLGDGSTLRSGPYRDVVKKGVLWLREQQDPETGLFGTNNSNEFVYNHAIATLAMVEACGLSDSRMLRQNAQAAINYLEWHRNPYSVWRYHPRDGADDTSVTGWCVMAYKSAEDFGLDVNSSAMKLAETWFDQMTDPVSGRCGYTERGGLSSRRVGQQSVQFPREKGECMTAVSLLSRFFLGHTPEEHPIMATQADLVLAKPPVWDEAGGAIDQYYWYYATYALYQMGGRHWTNWSKALTTSVVDKQRDDGHYVGSWDPSGAWGEDGGRVYSTAILCLTLEAYYRYTRLVR